jgi:phosphopantothenoylcysteine decarboxylase/phosphopantothenate--cysteine ligase
MKIILGVTGSIAAYKSALLLRDLIKSGHEVKVVMTQAAKDFISPLTLSTLSKNKVYYKLIDDDKWNNHVELAEWADLLLIAPATGNTISKLASGIADNLLTVLTLAFRKKIIIAPAMDKYMIESEVIQENMAKLSKQERIKILDTNEGELASGLIGRGRMLEPREIMKIISDKNRFFQDKKILINAGPTRENIDPVRFITNSASGKTGILIAEALNNMGADITLILGPTNEKTNIDNVIHVKTAEEMLSSMKQYHNRCDIVFFTAAVTDFKPKSRSNKKLKKQESKMRLDLDNTPDIAYELSKNKTQEQIHVGFAIETNQATKNAKKKLKQKDFDMIVLNSINDKHNPLGSNKNEITIITDSQTKNYPMMTKDKIVIDILKFIEKNFK